MAEGKRGEAAGGGGSSGGVDEPSQPRGGNEGGAAVAAARRPAEGGGPAAPAGRTGTKRAPRRRFGAKDKQAFLEYLAATCNASEAARSVGWPTATVHWNRRNDPAFAAGWKEATDAAYDRLEEALLAHALKAARPVDFDPDAVDIVIADPEPGEAREGKAGRFTVIGTQLALRLLGTRAAAEEKGRRRPAHKRRATPDEVMEAINGKLDKLARKMGGEG